MKYIIANWKMNMDLAGIKTWSESFRIGYHSRPGIEVVIAPSFPYLEEIKKQNLVSASQDISVFEKGAHTGEVGAFELKDFCKYAIVGHSERKENFETVLVKRDNCLTHGIIPIVCFTDPSKVTEYYKENAIMAWEDPSYISSGGSYHPADISVIKAVISEIKRSIPEKTPVIYGGSVNRQNIAELVKITELDGVLVGNASTDPIHFSEIIASYLG